MTALAEAPARPEFGFTEARLFTPPLRELTPETSLGFECVAFASVVLGVTLDPWQQWFLIRALELREDGQFRFRTVLLIVARQNGKTMVIRALILWAMFTRSSRVVGTAQDLDIARQSWDYVRRAIEDDPELSEFAPRGAIRTGNGKEEILLSHGARYVIKATNEDAARGVESTGLLILDELRTHRDYGAYGALVNTTMAVPDALVVAMSNAGSAQSVVLNELRELALSGTDPNLGLFEWSAATDDLDDPAGAAQANPSLGHGRLTWRALESARAKADKSAEARAVYLVENLCRWVETMDHAVDMTAWRSSVRLASVADYRDAKLYGGLDVSRDGASVTLTIATPDPSGAVRLWVAQSWPGVDAARSALPATLKALRLRRLAWCPSGPGAALGAVVRAAGRRKDSVYGIELLEVRGDALGEASMGFAAAVNAHEVWHQGDPYLDQQVAGCAKLWQGDRWVFTRRGGQADAVYSAALAVHAAMSRRVRKPWGSNGEAEAEQAADEAETFRGSGTL